MIPVLSKPAGQVDTADIESLVTSRVPEGERIEFKRELPAKHGPASWMVDQKNIGDYAKNQILTEVVAFANAYGGALVLGIGEDESSEPAVAGSVCPVPRCEDLAGKFRLIFRDRVDPQINKLEIFPVVTNGAEDGVVVFRVPRSRLAPHGITRTWLCPVRRWDRSENMTMRQVQDLTLNVARGIERLDKKFEERAASFERDFQHVNSSHHAIGFRMTALPVDGDVLLDSVYGGNSKLVKELELARPNVTVMRHHRGIDHPRPLHGGRYNRMTHSGWKPILRGARTRHNMDRRPPMQRGKVDSYSYLELNCDGMVEFGAIEQLHKAVGQPGQTAPQYFFTDRLVVALGHVVCWTDALRRHANAVLSEYAIDISIRVTGGRAGLVPGIPRAVMGPEDAGVLPSGVTSFPRYPLITHEQQEISELVTRFQSDLCHAAELEALRDPLALECT